MSSPLPPPSGAYPRLFLRKDRDRSLRSWHPWIFSGAIERIDAECADGAIAEVVTAANEPLGYAYINRACSLTARMISFGKSDPLLAVRANIRSAIELRKKLPLGDTDCMRLINAEGDGLSGLTVDRYGDVLVVQSGSLGIDTLKPLVLEELVETLRPRCVYERSSSGSRREEGLADSSGVLWGDLPEILAVRENGHRFTIDVARGQKTGFFLDQREMRCLVQSYSAGRSVLNCFSYTGGFSVYAAAGGATSVTSVDSSAPAIEAARAHMQQAPSTAADFIVGDAFDFLRDSPWDSDFVILDPPALAKHRKDTERASKAYRELNRHALMRVRGPGLLLTCSCSYHIDESAFRSLVFQAARECGRSVRVLSNHRHAPDHPVSLFHPEGSYLKSLLLAVA